MKTENKLTFEEWCEQAQLPVIRDTDNNVEVYTVEASKKLMIVIDLNKLFIGPSKSGKSQILAQGSEATAKIQTPIGPLHLTVLAYQTNKELGRNRREE